MKNNSKNELFFKNLASSYAEKSGNELKKEFDNLNSFSQSEQLDKKVKSAVKTAKIKRWTARLTPVAACFIILIIIAVNLPILNIFSNTNEVSQTPSAILTYDFVSTKLPSAYTLEKVDYDKQKAIYYIAGNEDNQIILTIEEFKGNINTDGLKKININNTNVYAISKADYSFIQYKKDDLLYTLTSPYDYYDLITLSENLI
ncbi:MAG: DUF4367 domain-containing protein [Oscillospiraceae bacterium]|nr:DUF4367 domain-containing protein [Oscillospiraceae bacterium]